MGSIMAKSNLLLTAILLALALWLPFARTAAAQEQDLDALFQRLQQPDLAEWKSVETEIWRQWSRSGSPAMDLLLQRGRDAMEEGDYPAAIEHLTALTDHAPGFAEGWNARATAFFYAGQYGPSIADIRQALMLEPRHFAALSGLGMIFEEMGRTEQAVEAFRLAHSIHPHATGINEALERLEAKVSGKDL